MGNPDRIISKKCLLPLRKQALKIQYIVLSNILMRMKYFLRKLSLNEFSRFPDLQINTESILLSNIPMVSLDSTPWLQGPDRSGLSPDSLLERVEKIFPQSARCSRQICLALKTDLFNSPHYSRPLCRNQQIYRVIACIYCTRLHLCGEVFHSHRRHCGRFYRCLDRNALQ